MKFYRAVAVPMFTYGSEIWTITKQKAAKIQREEMKLLRSVLRKEGPNKKY
jgi:hypothetical protein